MKLLREIVGYVLGGVLPCRSSRLDLALASFARVCRICRYYDGAGL